MFIKRILLAMPIVLAIVTMNAMNPVDIAQAKELMNKALVDPAFYGPFKEHYDKHAYDVDEIESEPGKTLGHLLTEALGNAQQRTAAVALAMLVHDNRSNDDIVYQTLYRACENSILSLEGLKGWDYTADVDEIDYDPAHPGKKIGQRITELLKATAHSKPAFQDVLKIAEAVQQDRSQQGSVFQTLYKIYESDPTVLEDLKDCFMWVFNDDVMDIDSIDYDPAIPGKTIGERITELLQTKEHRDAAFEVALMVQSDRSQPHAVVQTLYKAYESDPTVLEYLKRIIDKIKADAADESEDSDSERGDPIPEIDVDRIAYNLALPGSTIGDRITYLLSLKAHRKEALALAKVVEKFRSNHSVVFQALYQEYSRDSSVLDDIKNWLVDFIEDVDEIKYDAANPGKTIAQHLTEQLTTKAHRNAALALAKIMQVDRTEKDSVLRTLIGVYENDPTAFDVLKEWQEYVKADVTVIRYNPAHTETIAERIDALQKDDLSKLFNRTTTTPASPKIAPKGTSWSSGKVFGATALIVGAGLVYYYMKYKDPKSTDPEQSKAQPTTAQL